MTVSRRRFLKNGAVAAAAFVAAPLPAAWSGTRESSADLTPSSHTVGLAGILTRQAFEQAVGSAFQVSSPAGSFAPIWLTLLKVEDLPALVPVNPGIMAVPPPKISTSVTTSGFMVTFNSSAAPLPQGVYTFHHPVLGTFALLIVPEGLVSKTYTAVFNMVNTSAGHFRPPSRVQPLGRAKTSNGGGGGIPSSSPSFREPAQQEVEPVFRDRLEPKLPE